MSALAQPAEKAIIKVTMNLPSEDVQVLKRLAEKRHTTVTHVLRQAIATEKFVADLLDEGAKILVEKGDDVREIVFRF